MSEYTPITGELRGMMLITESEQGTPMVELGWFRFKQLCDSIDAIHAALEAECEQYRDGWVELPKDAHGEYIHIGDRMENNERVARIVLTDDSWEPSVYLEKLPNVLHEYFCNEVSHYHAHSVEDVLREFALACEDAGNAGPEVERIAAEYAARLRLAGDE